MRPCCCLRLEVTRTALRAFPIRTDGSRISVRKYAWAYAYAANPHIDGRVINLARGKVLGGSGSINATMWARGSRADYDGWAKAGNEAGTTS